MRLLFVRHGESAWNALRKLQGQADVALSQRGREQALRLAPLVAGLAPDLVVGSDLSRTRETASLLGYGTAGLDSSWREIDVGDWTACDIDALRRDHGEAYDGWRAGTYTPAGGETWDRFCGRIGGATDQLGRASVGKECVSTCSSRWWPCH